MESKTQAISLTSPKQVKRFTLVLMGSIGLLAALLAIYGSQDEQYVLQALSQDIVHSPLGFVVYLIKLIF